MGGRAAAPGGLPLYDQPDATEWEPLALIAVAVVPS